MIFTKCTKECKIVYQDGKGSFAGWRLKLCKDHQVIHKMWKREK
jgi:hypothetical protein